jgi:hypothetical protein
MLAGLPDVVAARRLRSGLADLEDKLAVTCELEDLPSFAIAGDPDEALIDVDAVSFSGQS